MTVWHAKKTLPTLHTIFSIFNIIRIRAANSRSMKMIWVRQNFITQYPPYIKETSRSSFFIPSLRDRRRLESEPSATMLDHFVLTRIFNLTNALVILSCNLAAKIDPVEIQIIMHQNQISYPSSMISFHPFLFISSSIVRYRAQIRSRNLVIKGDSRSVYYTL